jgi:hypothetical protein
VRHGAGTCFAGGQSHKAEVPSPFPCGSLLLLEARRELLESGKNLWGTFHLAWRDRALYLTRRYNHQSINRLPDGDEREKRNISNNNRPCGTRDEPFWTDGLAAWQPGTDCARKRKSYPDRAMIGRRRMAMDPQSKERRERRKRKPSEETSPSGTAAASDGVFCLYHLAVCLSHFSREKSQLCLYIIRLIFSSLFSSQIK